MRQFFVVALLLLLALAPGAVAGLLLYEPQDKTIALSEVTKLSGEGKNLTSVQVNGRQLKLAADGSFACGLLLRPGKNLVQLAALDQEGKSEQQAIRVLLPKIFADLETLYQGKKHWARNQIVYLATLGYIEGYPDSNFYPANPVTRGELATWLARAQGLAIPSLKKDVFFDVPKEHWRAPFIKAVVEAGYLSSYTQEIFGIDDPVTRREAAKFAVEAEGLSQAPEQPLSRAEAAVLLARLSKVLADIRQLYDFEQGYGSDSACQVNVAPEILAFTVLPKTVKRAEPAPLSLRLVVVPRGNFSPLSKVKVDLSKLGGLPDIEMYDDGTHGDEQAGDLTYTLNFTLEPSTTGEKNLTATAIDRLGWESEKQTSLLILE